MGGPEYGVVEVEGGAVATETPEGAGVPNAVTDAMPIEEAQEVANHIDPGEGGGK